MSEGYRIGKDHASAYAKYRPSPPKELVEKIVKFVNEKIPPPLTRAVDVGCGSGQSTFVLSPYFQNVLGTDISDSQLEEARAASESYPNVAFSVAGAEELPIENSTVQLITASQCFHWFDAEKFYSEAKRILVPNGVLAVHAYLLPVMKSGDEQQDRKLYDHLMSLYDGSLADYFDAARYMVDSKYDKVQLPFENIQRADGIWTSKTSSVADYQGYLSSWSSYHKYVKSNGESAGQKLLSDFTKGVLEILHSPKSAEETTIQVDIEFFLLMGRNPANKD